MSRDNNRMKTNFDKLEAAGLVASADDGVEVQKIKTAQRMEALAALSKKLTNVHASANQLYTLPKDKQLKQLGIIKAAVSKLMSTSLPVGTKRPLEKCMNELISLREGVFTGAATDRNALTLFACKEAVDEITRLQLVAAARLEKVTAASSNVADLDDYYKNAETVIKKHAPEAAKLDAIKDKPFVAAQVPVIPKSDGLSIEKLIRQGFTTDNLSSYAVIHKQIVIGINPSQLEGIKDTSKRDASHAAILAKADKIRKQISKLKGEKLFFVSDQPRKYKTGAWFWLMTERDLNRFAKCFTGNAIKISDWGFGFN